MKCPECSNRLTKPIYQCINGHIICAKCKQNIINCSECKCDYADIRNYDLEEVLETTKFPCRNTQAGCVENLYNTELEKHEKICIYRKYKCFVHSCDWRDRKCNIYNHFKEEHPTGIKDTHSQSYDAFEMETENRYVVMYAYDELFYVDIIPRDGSIYWIAYYIGSSEYVSKFFYEIELKSKSNSKQYFKSSAVCYSDDMTANEVIEVGSCVTTSTKYYKSFEDSHGEVYRTITIHKD